MKRYFLSALVAIGAWMALPQSLQARVCASPEHCSVAVPDDPPAQEEQQKPDEGTETVTQPQPDGTIKIITTTVVKHEDGSTTTTVATKYLRP